MSATLPDYFESVIHLPPGARVTLQEISWEEYEELLAFLGDHTHLRVSYNLGRLEIMSPSARHEKLKNLAHDLIVVLGDELRQDIISYGSVTLKLQPRGKGAEGDDCFYIQRADAIAGRDRLDLSQDPPPDLVVEVDLTHESGGKLDIYASLGVPEIWRYNGYHWELLHLAEGIYHPVAFSVAFPFLSAEHIAEFVANSESMGPYRARQSLRAWVQAALQHDREHPVEGL